MDFLIADIKSRSFGGGESVCFEHRTQHAKVLFLGECPRVVAKSQNDTVVAYALGPGATNSTLVATAQEFINTNGEENELCINKFKDIQASFIIIIVDKSSERFWVIGDVFGSIPVYRSTTDTSLISSAPEFLVADWSDPFDAISYRDMLVNERICFPYTAYKGVRQISPTCYSTIDAGGLRISETSWMPPVISPQDLSSYTLVALQDFIRESCEGKNVHVALSGGLDSRILLSMATSRAASVRAFSISDGPSRDSALAAMVAEHRRVKHDVHLVGVKDFDGQGLVMAELAGSQNRWYHGHLMPLFQILKSNTDLMLGGYGSNTNFSNYDSVQAANRRISKDADEPRYRSELLRRWAKHLAYVECRFALDGNRLAMAWPCTNKRAFAYYQVNRQMTLPLEPFMLMRSMFSSKAMPDALRANVAEDLFREVCADEANLPVTQETHPLGAVDLVDPTVGLPDAGWPRKERMLPQQVEIPECVRALGTRKTGYQTQLAAVYLINRGKAVAGEKGGF